MGKQLAQQVLFPPKGGLYLRVLKALVLVAALLFQTPLRALAGEQGLPSHMLFDGNIVLENPLAPCQGTCGIHVFAGRFLNTNLSTVLGVEGYEPPLGWKYGGSGLFGVALSRRLLTAFESFSIVGEIGAAQRFGDKATAMEGWSALYFRWHNFPWNRFVYTTVGFSTGLSYATNLDRIETRRSAQGNSKLLHYFSPEVTFALPERKDWSLVLRLHHRSGGREYLGSSGIFKGTDGGAQYLTIGIRKDF